MTPIRRDCALLDQRLHVQGAAQFDVDEGRAVQMSLDQGGAAGGVERALAALVRVPRGQDQGQRDLRGQGADFSLGKIDHVEAQLAEIAVLSLSIGLRKSRQSGAGSDHPDHQRGGGREQISRRNHLRHNGYYIKY